MHLETSIAEIVLLLQGYARLGHTTLRIVDWQLLGYSAKTEDICQQSLF